MRVCKQAFGYLGTALYMYKAVSQHFIPSFAQKVTRWTTSTCAAIPELRCCEMLLSSMWCTRTMLPLLLQDVATNDLCHCKILLSQNVTVTYRLTLLLQNIASTDFWLFWNVTSPDLCFFRTLCCRTLLLKSKKKIEPIVSAVPKFTATDLCYCC